MVVHNTLIQTSWRLRHEDSRSSKPALVHSLVLSQVTCPLPPRPRYIHRKPKNSSKHETHTQKPKQMSQRPNQTHDWQFQRAQPNYGQFQNEDSWTGEWICPLDSCFELQFLNCAHLFSCKGFQVLGKYEFSSFSPKGHTLQEHLLYLTTSTEQTHPNQCFLYGLICTHLSFLKSKLPRWWKQIFFYF